MGTHVAVDLDSVTNADSNSPIGGSVSSWCPSKEEYLKAIKSKQGNINKLNGMIEIGYGFFMFSSPFL